MDTETRIGVNAGDTFTDVALLTPEGRLVTAEVPSTDDQSVGVVRGIERACDDAGVDPAEVDASTHAMTVSVNVLLEDDGATTAFVTTGGFCDAFEIGRQAQPDLYDVTTDEPILLVPCRRRFGVTEQATVEGIQIEADELEVRAFADDIRDAGVESVAVSLLHAYRHPENKRVVADALREELDTPASVSYKMLAEFREFERTSIITVDTYATLVIDSYLGRFESRAADLGIPVPQIMQANGGIALASTVCEYAVTTTTSGPATGVVGTAETATGSGDDLAGLVIFDMGGTSSDVSLAYDGEVERTINTEINGQPTKTPMVDVNTVGVGGGSIAWVDSGNVLRVRPRLSGANPGPACYGHGGTEPTVTDANVVLGYISGSSAPGSELSFDVDVVRDALSGPAADAGLDDALVAARGAYRVANANMTRAIRAVTVGCDRDPRQFGLATFGGVEPMHAATLAESLNIETVAVPRACGVLSVYGLLAADQEHDSVWTFRRPLSSLDVEAVESAYVDLEADTLDDATDPDDAAARRAADFRYVGQSSELIAPVGETSDVEAVEAWFYEAHGSAYGYCLDDPVELVNVRATVAVEHDPLDVTYRGGGDARKDTREALFDGEFRETPVYDRDGLDAGTTVEEPTILGQYENTVVVPPVWGGTAGANGMLALTGGGDGE